MAPLRRVLRVLGRSALVLAGAWATLAVFWSNLPGLALRAAGAVAYLAFCAACVRRGARRAFLASVAVVLAWHLLIRPSNDRPWSADQDVLPEIRLDGDRLAIRHVRDFGYRGVDDFLPRRVDRVWSLAALEGADFVVEHFSAWEGAGHSFVTFRFAGAEPLAVSAEIRKERGETYGALAGMFKRYELMYVVGTERDLVGLRRNVRGHPVALYPIRASRDDLRRLLTDLLGRASALQARPEFYHTLANACTTNLADHVNALRPGRVPFSLKVQCAGYADVLAYALGLIDTDVPLEALRARHRIPAVPLDHPDYSNEIRRKK